jgi:hypothetical protein
MTAFSPGQSPPPVSTPTRIGSPFDTLARFLFSPATLVP